MLAVKLVVHPSVRTVSRSCPALQAFQAGSTPFGRWLLTSPVAPYRILAPGNASLTASIVTEAVQLSVL